MAAKQIAGFALLRRPPAVLASHQAFIARAWGADRADSYLQKLGSALPFIDRYRYRGIARDPLEPDDKGSAAEQRFREMVGPRTTIDADEALIPELDWAMELKGLLDDPEGYEILRLEREPFTTKAGVLGYDVGYWGGDHFSLIADTAVTPTWHPVPLSHIAPVAAKLRTLNEHLLFRTREDAVSFREFYISEPWAEGETPDATFQVIQLSDPAQS